MMKLKPYPEYKDSGVEWLERIPVHWGSSRTAYMFSKANAGEVIDKSHWGEGNEQLFTCARRPLSSDYPNFPSYKRTTDRDLLLTRNGTPYVHKPPRGAIYSNVVQRIALKQELNREFVSYALGSACLGLKGYGVSIESLNFEMWKSLRLALPMETEQSQIAGFLDAKMHLIDRFIRNKRRLIELLQEQKQAVINACVTGKMEVRRIVDENGNSSFRLQPSSCKMRGSGIDWLGEIPAHWKICLFKRVATTSYGRGGELDRTLRIENLITFPFGNVAK